MPVPPDIHCVRHATELLCELNAPDPLRLMRAKWANSGDPAVFRELLSQHLSLGDIAAAQDLVSDYAARHS